MKIDLGDDCFLRPFAHSDAESIARHANNPKVAVQLRDRFPHPYTVDDARRFIDAMLAEPPHTVFVIANEAEAFGSVGIHPQADIYRATGELGYWLGELWWGRGIATRAVAAATDCVFERLGLARVQAFVFESNPASARVLEKAGFTREGVMRSAVTKRGVLLDQYLYAKTREVGRA